MIKLTNIRNFSIIAHIDHGKSTLADRIIQHCGGLSEREMKEQILDNMELERERGITIKAQSVSLKYKAKDGEIYQLNFIDTPGHVDFSYEVSRSLAACEGALLVVDASQGVEAQTVAVCYTAVDQGLEILPVLNKIDLPQADPEKVINEIENVIGLDASNALSVSAKTGVGVTELLEMLVQKIAPPSGNNTANLQALIIDSWFDNYLGVVSLIKIKQGKLQKGDRILVMTTGKNYNAEEIGIFTPKKTEKEVLFTGEVGYLISNVKDIFGAPVGDTITLVKNPCKQQLPGFQKVKPQVFAGIFPVTSSDYEILKISLAKLHLNDAALSYETENSGALGFGFRCGFLGMLHMEIIQQRLEREYNLDLIITAPTVIYQVVKKNQQCIKTESPSQLPPVSDIDHILEPIAEANILVPKEYLGNVMKLCIERKGIQKQLLYVANQVSLVYELPMSEIVLDFFDHLKSASKGFASLDYHFIKFQQADVVKINILVNNNTVDALATIVRRSDAQYTGRILAKKLQKLIPRQMFDIAIQVAIGGHIIARSTVKALRKNVTAKCYGGDITRKKKLLEKQKKGKKRMKQIGNVSIPQSAFLAVLKAKN